MSIISINDLNLAGSDLFSDSESFIGSMQDLSENELKVTLGGKKSKKSSSGSSSKSSASRSSGDNCCHCHCGGGGGGGPN